MSSDYFSAAQKVARFLAVRDHVEAIYYAPFSIGSEPTIVFSDIRREGESKWNARELDALLRDEPFEYQRIMRRYYADMQGQPRLVVVKPPFDILATEMPTTNRILEFAIAKGYFFGEAGFIRANPPKKTRLIRSMEENKLSVLDLVRT